MEIECKHGKGVAAVVCMHLLNSKKSEGFSENSSVPRDFQGWCSNCEIKYLEEGEMNERFRIFNDAKLVCEDCYHHIKGRHFIEED